MAEAPWRRRIGTAPKTWVVVMALGVFVSWLPFAGRSLSPDEAGYLIVGGQWSHGSSLYGDYWVDRPPALVAIFEAADALGGAVPLRLFGALAALLTVVLSGVLGRIAAPERRSAPLLTAGTAAVCVATPLFGGTVVNGELLGMPFLVAGILAYVAAAASRHQKRGLALSLAAGAAGAVGALVKQSLVDVFVVAAVLVLTSGAARRKVPGLLAGALATTALVVVWASARGTAPADLWDAVVTFRIDAARELAGTHGKAPGRLAGLVGALAASGVPLVVAAFAWKGRGEPSRQGPLTAPDLRVAAYTLLTFDLLVAFLGGSYWLHYLMGLVPGAVLFAASFAQRPAPVTRSIGISLALAGVSSVATLSWTAATPIDRHEQPAIAYLEDHAQRGDSGVVVLGAPNVIRDAGLEAPYPYLWSLPARVRDADLATLDGLLESESRPTWVIVARGSVDFWELDFSRAQALLDADYEKVDTAGKFTIYRRTA
jgi:4-amino-4-deoxy-L-arabinose transferase-like glycosyltransferase